jgi:CBS domain-containing protein
MQEHTIGSLVVVEQGGLAGIITERDLVRAAGDGTDPLQTTVDRYLTTEPASATPDEGADHVARRMLNLGVRHLPVVDQGKVVGMVSIRDLLMLHAWQPGEPIAL